MTSQNTRIAKNTIFLSLRMVFVLFISLYTSRVFLNVLGVVDYGISNVVAGFVSMFGFFNTSLANAIQRFYNNELGTNGRDGVTKVYNTSLVIQSIIALVVFVLLETIGLWYLYEKMVIPFERFDTAFWLYQFSTISAVLVIIQSPFSAAIMAYEHMNTYAIISIVDVVLKFILAIILPFVSYDKLLVYGATYLLITFVDFAFNYIYAKRQFPELHIKLENHKYMFKDMISFSGWNLFGTFACMIREHGLNLVLNLFFGPAVNAARGIAYQVSSALQGFVSNLSLAAKPQMVQSYATGDSTRTIKLMYIMSKLSFVFLFVLSVPVILNINYILNLWLGDVIPEHTANFIILILLTMFMNNLNAPLSNVVYATGKMRNYQITFSIINLLIIPVSYMSLKLNAPAEAVFIIYFVMTIFVQIACLLVLKTLVSISLRQYFVTLILPLAIVVFFSLPIAAVINYIVPAGISRIILEYFVVFCITLIISYIVMLDSSEKKVVKQIVNKIKK